MTAGEAARFNTFAIWSPELDKKPDNRLIATTGGAEGVVQFWRAPTRELRGAEVARLYTRRRPGPLARRSARWPRTDSLSSAPARATSTCGHCQGATSRTRSRPE